MQSLLLSSSLVAAYNQITIKENGVDKTLYVADSDDVQADVSGSSVSIHHTGRSYLATKDSGSIESDMFYAPNLLGGAIEWDMDLSQSTCSCNAALYLISMPGLDQDGNPWPSEVSDYYCDANQVGGNFCPEMDIMEANTWAWHTTPHKCDDPTDKGHYWWCDKTGTCGTIVHSIDPNAYGPGDNYTINTLKTFHAKLEFQASGDQLDDIVTTLSQDDKKFSWTTADKGCDFGYLQKMKDYLKSGMTLAISNWGTDYDTMSWLDEDTGCKGVCDGNPTISFSNISYWLPQSETPLDECLRNCASDDAEECGARCAELEFIQ